MSQAIFEQAVSVIFDRRVSESNIHRADIEDFLSTASEDRDYEHDYGADDDGPLWYQIENLVKLAPIPIRGAKFYENDFDALIQAPQIAYNLNQIRFEGCEFDLMRLPTLMADFQFINCSFLQDFQVPAEGAGDLEALFIGCEFLGGALLIGEDRRGIDWGNGLTAIFKDCSLKNILIERTRLRAKLFGNTKSFEGSMGVLKVIDCQIDAALDISAFSMKGVLVKDTKFKGKVVGKASAFGFWEAEASRFKSAVDFEGATFGRMAFDSCKFFDVLNLENAKFTPCDGLDKSTSAEEAVRYRFCTFEKMVNFRNANFDVALDLRHSNRKELPNFLGAVFNRVAGRKTDRETFRIIKNSFEAVGNHVEANEYFAMEMEAYRLELKDRKNKLSERFLLFCNGLLSRHGQSYVRPLGFIIAFMLGLQLLHFGYEHNWIYSKFPEARPYIELLNDWAGSLIIFKSLLTEKGFEFVSLIFGVIFSILVWQTVSAIRRHTRK